MKIVLVSSASHLLAAVTALRTGF